MWQNKGSLNRSAALEVRGKWEQVELGLPSRIGHSPAGVSPVLNLSSSSYLMKLRVINNVHQEVVSHIEKDTGFCIQKIFVVSGKLFNLSEPPFCHI